MHLRGQPVNGNWIQRARQEITDLQRRRAAKNRLDKLTSTENTVEIELFLDDCKVEGLNENNPVHLAIMLRAWCLKKGEKLQDEMEREHDDLSF
jgi:hypothetical protein